MRRVQSGEDSAAFGLLFDRHHARALAVAIVVCRDRARAEDAVQEGFLTIWRSRAEFRAERGSFRTWSMTVIRHRAIDWVRSEAALQRPKLAGPEPLDRVPSSESVEADAIDKSQGRALLATIAQLPKAQAEVIALAFYAGLSHSEIAIRLELAQGTVKGRMRLGLRKLRATTEPLHDA